MIKISQPFVFYSGPGSTEIWLITGNPTKFNRLDQLTKASFVFSPFNIESATPSWAFDASEPYVFPAEELDNYELDLPQLPLAHLPNATSDEYLTFIEGLKKTMKQQGLQKTVASRVKSVPRNHNPLLKLYKSLVLKYPNAFVYLALLPGYEIWCGASPEVLAKYKHNQLETMALAGTQKLGEREIEELVWQQKERGEQNWVQEYIGQTLTNSSVQWEKGPTESLQAGNLVHIKTVFSAHCTPSQATEIVKQLHPTPAVCGLPAREAMQVLLKAESHQRTYYTGFMGFYSPENFQLFVNLRCMRVDQSYYHLFVGGGITHDSDPELEWLETEHKALTLESVIFEG